MLEMNYCVFNGLSGNSPRSTQGEFCPGTLSGSEQSAPLVNESWLDVFHRSRAGGPSAREFLDSILYPAQR